MFCETCGQQLDGDESNTHVCNNPVCKKSSKFNQKLYDIWISRKKEGDKSKKSKNLSTSEEQYIADLQSLRKIEERIREYRIIYKKEHNKLKELSLDSRLGERARKCLDTILDSGEFVYAYGVYSFCTNNCYVPGTYKVYRLVHEGATREITKKYEHVICKVKESKKQKDKDKCNYARGRGCVFYADNEGMKHAKKLIEKKKSIS